MKSLHGILFRGWESVNINRKSIFDLKSEENSTYLDIVGTALILAVMWAVSLLVFLYADFLYISAFYSPLILMISYVVFLFNPVKVFRYKSRLWILRITSRIIVAPLAFVTFSDFWVKNDKIRKIKKRLNKNSSC